MRRFFLGMAIASLTAGAPLTAFGGDREIADAIITAVKKSQVSLSGLEVDLTVENGNVLITGTVAQQSQLDSVLNAARNIDGVKSVENQAKLVERTPAKTSELVSPVIPASANDSTSLRIEDDVTVSDAEITSEILGNLSQSKRVGQLRNFDLNVSTVDGDVTVRGSVASQQQKDLVLGTARNAAGVRTVVDELVVTNVRAVSNEVPVVPQANVAAPGVQPRAFAASTINSAPAQIAPVQVAPVQAAPAQLAPVPMAAVRGAPVAAGVVAPQAPVPMGAGPSYGGGVPRSDSPYMPGYAWPSYAAYPNYSAVTYPKQYSASAWPYIGPFYPYPQVPLGWRRVSLEWDDGLWYLDFTHK
ncbi:MAG: BON domain-containing protein [Planctomycetota bacterium]